MPWGLLEVMLAGMEWRMQYLPLVFDHGVREDNTRKRTTDRRWEFPKDDVLRAAYDYTNRGVTNANNVNPLQNDHFDPYTRLVQSVAAVFISGKN